MELNKIYQGDCLELIKDIDDNSIDAVITDPPYELGFMGKYWDASGITYNVSMWQECLRILKPGGYLLSFGGSRTYHRMACAIEDAGFEIRDQIMWVYGSGFPKSLDISKAIDKIEPRLGKFDKFAKHLSNQIKIKGISQKEISKHFLSKTGGLTGCVWNWANGANVPTLKQWNILKPMLDLSDEFTALIEREEAEREVIGKQYNIANKNNDNTDRYNWNTENQTRKDCIDITAPSSPFAIQWQGWGTALKPAHEPICMARKPLSEKTVAENVLKWGTGGINIDECRIETEEQITNHSRSAESAVSKGKYGDSSKQETHQTNGQILGRFPANLIHDGSDEVMAEFGKVGISKTGDIKPHKQNLKGELQFNTAEEITSSFTGDSGTPARFFYCAKASKSERDMGCEGNNHPTVKPIKLMEYLVKLVTVKDAIVLDPFCGSGSTLIACKNLNRNYIGIDNEIDYVEIAEKRLGVNKFRQEALI